MDFKNLIDTMKKDEDVSDLKKVTLTDAFDGLVEYRVERSFQFISDVLEQDGEALLDGTLEDSHVVVHLHVNHF